MNWHQTTVGEIITTKKGFAFKSAKYVKKGVPIVRVSDYTLDSISDEDLKYYPLEEKQNYHDFELHKNDVIVQTVGSWQNNPASVVGKVVRVPYNLDGALLNQNAVRLTPVDDVDNNYLFYRLRSDEFKGHVLGEARGAANQASITLETIKSFTFSIPDYDTQKRIGEILSAYDSLIENNKNQIKLLEEAAQRLYKEWFVDLRFPGYEETEIIDGIPNGWAKKSILENDIFIFSKNKVCPFDGEKQYYATADITGTTISADGATITYMNKPSRASVQPVNNSVWFARMSNTYKILNCFGESSHLAYDSVISSGFAGFTALEGCFGFVYATIASKRFDDEKNRYATGATQVSLTNEGLKK